MKIHKLLFYCFSLFSLFACTVQDSKEQAIKLTKIFVESGRIEKNLFVSNGAFKASDATLGRIDSTEQSKNGFLGSDDFAYVFEGEKIPEKFAALDDKDMSKKLSLAAWTKDFTYTLSKDAHICQNHPIYYIREAGDYTREVASIDGEKIFRLKNRYVIEDYSNLMDYIYEFHTDKNPVNIFTALGISPETHTVSASRKDLIVNAETGYIDYDKSTKTALNTQDKLIFKPKSKGKTYRLRFVLTTYDEKTSSTFYDKNGSVPASLRPNWKQYLRETKLLQYLEQEYKGFGCANEIMINKADNDSAPPPPIF